ncbi:flagellar assembly protein FliW [Bacteriovorax sp. DB6_IX]|uniref:flagellar assembly protein FliW n=1 Tax=Bacteriovorax sp. DB6_IX TaxID=1353530 RepID=UPI00038A3269|nr:flagellar assembly protein FliW [Bacteriovorax sp. DB6_IX]EQC52353.1 protein FliW [Bacteriovorax sp. DB6_IX]
MKINTTRFGELEVEKKDIITFDEGILGFENLKEFFVVDPGDQTLILWLQSAEDGATAFPIIEPKIFKPDFAVNLLPAELNSLKLENLSNASVYTILTIPQDVTTMSANLKAPVIINNQTKKARQIVLQDSKLEVKFEMYNELKKYIVSYHSDDSVRTTVTMKNEPTVVEQTTETSQAPINHNSAEL